MANDLEVDDLFVLGDFRGAAEVFFNAVKPQSKGWIDAADSRIYFDNKRVSDDWITATDEQETQ